MFLIGGSLVRVNADYCAEHKIFPQIKAEEINDAWSKVLNKEARYRFVIYAATI